MMGSLANLKVAISLVRDKSETESTYTPYFMFQDMGIEDRHRAGNIIVIQKALKARVCFVPSWQLRCNGCSLMIMFLRRQEIGSHRGCPILLQLPCETVSLSGRVTIWVQAGEPSAPYAQKVAQTMVMSEHSPLRQANPKSLCPTA